MPQNFDFSGLNNDKQFFRVMIFPDFHWGDVNGGADYATRLPLSISAMNAYEPDVYITIGDQFAIENFVPDDDTDPNYYIDMIADFMAEMENLSAPWVWVGGNHDWVYPEHPDYATMPNVAEMEAVLDTYGVDYSEPKLLTFNGVQILIFDWTEEYYDNFPVSSLTVPSADLTWISNNIDPVKPLILAQHYGMVEDFVPGRLTLTNEDALMQTLCDNGNPILTISGHLHTEEHGRWRHLNQISVRRMGAQIGDNKGWCVLDIAKDSYSYFSVRADGTAVNDYVRYQF